MVPSIRVRLVVATTSPFIVTLLTFAATQTPTYPFLAIQTALGTPSSRAQEPAPLDFVPAVATQVGSRAKRQLPVPAGSANLSATEQKPAVTTEQRADIHLARKEYADAIEGYRRALSERGARDAYLWNKLGIACQMDQNYPAARKAYKKAAHTKSDFAEPWNNLGTTYYLQNRFGKSTRYYNRAIKLRPDVASFHMNLGASYSRMKRVEGAIAECQEALRLDPNLLSRHSRSATTVQTRGTDAEFYYYLAKAFASMSRPNEAIRCLRRALEDGFKDMKRLDDDPDFQKIGHYPALLELRKNPPVPIQD
jgi:tetratricopeptide (TPR) repeat protein